MNGGHLDEGALLRDRPTAELSKWRMRAVGLAVVGIAASAYGYTIDRQLFAQSYLIAFIFWTGITVGSLALLMVQYLSGGGWGLFARRVFEASTRNLWLLALLFIPIATHLPSLYPWARPDEVAANPDIQEKVAYLNPNFFYLRAAGFFVIWGALAFLLNRWSKEQDDNPIRPMGPKDGRMRVLSGPGLVLYMLTVTFMAVDWVMSLEPHFTSTIFGILTLGGQGLSTLAFTILVLAGLSHSRPVSEVAQPRLFHDLGKLMLALVMLWAYFSFSQFLIIWAGNLPEEIPYYLKRLDGGWKYLSLALAFGHFILPFCLLLSADLKKRPKLLARVAWFIVAMRLYDTIWLVAPVFQPAGALPISLANIGIPLALAGAWLVLFAGQLGKLPLLPVNDPYFKQMLASPHQGGH